MEKKDIKTYILLFIGVLIALGIAIFQIYLIKENKYLKEQLEFYEEESLREGPILYVNEEGSTILVYDTLKEKVIEVDVYDETIHTTIEVGDTAIYVVDYNYTDADLITIIKRRDS